MLRLLSVSRRGGATAAAATGASPYEKTGDARIAMVFANGVLLVLVTECGSFLEVQIDAPGMVTLQDPA